MAGTLPFDALYHVLIEAEAGTRMARLILINGLPGAGKSTLARRYARDHPLSLCLDIDEIRGLLGAWKAHFGEAGALARKLAIAMARVALRDGRDVVVPQFLGRPEFVGALQVLADEVGVAFVEVVLLDDLDRAKMRLAARAAGPLTPTQRDAHEHLDQTGGLGSVAELRRRLMQVVATRPATRILGPTLDDVERTYHDLLASMRGSLRDDA